MIVWEGSFCLFKVTQYYVTKKVGRQNWLYCQRVIMMSNDTRALNHEVKHLWGEEVMFELAKALAFSLHLVEEGSDCTFAPFSLTLSLSKS